MFTLSNVMESIMLLNKYQLSSTSQCSLLIWFAYTPAPESMI